MSAPQYTLGHLQPLAMPQAYNASYSKWLNQIQTLQDVFETMGAKV